MKWFEIRSSNDFGLEEARRIYRTSFPPEQLMSKEWEDALPTPGETTGTPHLLAARGDATGDVVAMVFYEVIAIPATDAQEAFKLAYVWYLAVAENVRGHGIGSKLLDDLLARIFDCHQCSVVLLEVESPEEMANRSAAEMALRRIAWYRRMGFRLVEGAVCQVETGTGSTVPMLLMERSICPISPEDAVSLYIQATGQAVDITAPEGLSYRC